MSVGMDSFLKKPYQLHEIYECLNKKLGIKFTFSKTEKNITQKQLTSKMLEKIDIKKMKKNNSKP